MQLYRFSGVVVLAIVGLQLAACGGPQPTTTRDAKPLDMQDIQGSNLKRLVLSEQAGKRLGIEVAPVREELTTRTRLTGGEIVQPPGGFTVRVRLNVSDYEALDATRPVRVMPAKPAAREQARAVIGEPVAAPPISIPASASAAAALSIPVDFTLSGSDHGFTAAERVMVELSLKGGGMRKIVPYSALVYELNGDTWVYTSPEPRVFVRQRVVADYINGNLAVLTDGPASGSQVVSVGATELYGAELRVGK